MNKEEYLAKQEKEAQKALESQACNWITVYELQTKLKISRSTVYRWILKGALRAYRLKGSHNIYFNNAEVDRFLSMSPISPSGRLDKLTISIYGNKTEDTSL